ncbi:c329aafc-e799-4457-b5e3-469a95f484e8 [Sclerotinia trifoliorum]|uniref:DASH complex subunit DAD4 n=1 Tax=Sclerotinia trifoliorum TaxID=28548 RepID=A0A8H2ZSR8_9HELO|nr:c329aafc-e799-4457-b5e3-469a95f484e8 [Sclerotinia trifoliorum]
MKFIEIFTPFLPSKRLTSSNITLHKSNHTKKIENMENPHEHQQNLLLSRIITNVEKLNEAIMLLNKNLQEINIANTNVVLVADMFKNYQSNVLFHLEATDSLKEPS